MRKIDAAGEEAKLRNWVAYIRTCRENNVEPRVPEDILVKLKRQGLLP